MKVLFIVGKGRSGSTLLDVALNSVEGTFSTGEIWRRWGGHAFDWYTCGCGRGVDECPLWSEVLGAAMEQTSVELDEEVTPSTIRRWERETLQHLLRTPGLLAARPGGGTAEGTLDRLLVFMSETYRQIERATGASVIVDSSKWPANPGPLGLVPGVEPFLVHLIRDPRAVSHSWRRRTQFLPDGLPMPRYGVTYSLLSWNMRNLLSEIVVRRRPDDHVLRIRYEDFVDRPVRTLRSILELVGMRDSEPPASDGHTFHLESNHTIWGNRSRFRTGEVEIRRDDAWRRELPTAARLVVTLGTLPLLLRYGYPLIVGHGGSG